MALEVQVEYQAWEHSVVSIEVLRLTSINKILMGYLESEVPEVLIKTQRLETGKMVECREVMGITSPEDIVVLAEELEEEWVEEVSVAEASAVVASAVAASVVAASVEAWVAIHMARIP